MNKFLTRSILILLILSGFLIGITTVLRVNANTVQNTQAVAGTTLGEPPIAVIIFPRNNTRMDGKSTIRFDASSSSDPDGGALEYFWEVDPIPDNWGQYETNEWFQTRFVIEGNYTITVTVTDEEGLTDQTFILLELYRTGAQATTTTAGVTTSETTIETTGDKDILTVRPNFLPGYSVLLAIFALFIPMVLKRKRNK